MWGHILVQEITNGRWIAIVSLLHRDEGGWEAEFSQNYVIDQKILLILMYNISHTMDTNTNPTYPKTDSLLRRSNKLGNLSTPRIIDLFAVIIYPGVSSLTI